MTRKLFAGTTAIALAISPLAPASLMAAAPELQFAQAQGSAQATDEHAPESKGKKAKAGKKDETATNCPDGSARPCGETEAAAPASGSAEPAKAEGEAQPAAVGDDSTAKSKKKQKDQAKAADEAQGGTDAATEASSEAAASAGASAEQPSSAAGADTVQTDQAATNTEEAAPVAAQESGQTTATEATSEATAPGKSAEAKGKMKKAEEAEATATGEAKTEADSAAAQPAPETAAQESQPAPTAEAQTDATSDQPKAEDQAAPAASTEATAPSATAEPSADDTETKRSKRESKTAAEAAAAAEQAPPAAAAAAAGAETQAEPVAVTTEVVTEETTRTSNEEVEQAASERREKKGDDKDDDLLKILGAAGGGLAAGVIIGTLLRDGSEVVDNTGDRVIVERDGQYYVRKDENEILRRPGSAVQTQTFSDGSSRTVVERADGTRVVTIHDQYGYVVRRHRVLPDGREILLFDDIGAGREGRPIERRELPLDYIDTLPQARYVDYSRADRRQLRETLMAQPVGRLDRSFSLRQVREIRELRDLVPGLDLDTITFESGSAAISYEQARNLDDLGRAMEDILLDNPDEVFLIEGHTDAVGSRLYNLTLSDRRAETVALALTEYYDIPPENLFTQGYGEEFLKINTEAPERANRRATVRRITPLLDRTAQLH